MTPTNTNKRRAGPPAGIAEPQRTSIMEFRNMDLLPSCPKCQQQELRYEEYPARKASVWIQSEDRLSYSGKGKTDQEPGYVMGTCLTCGWSWKLRGLKTLKSIKAFSNRTSRPPAE